MRRSVVMARWRACSPRRRAAAMRWRELSARIGGLRRVVADGFEFADHAVQVRGDLLVHLAHAGLAAGLGGADEGEGALVLLAELGQELGPGDEDGAGQAGVGV